MTLDKCHAANSRRGQSRNCKEFDGRYLDGIFNFVHLNSRAWNVTSTPFSLSAIKLAFQTVSESFFDVVFRR